MKQNTVIILIASLVLIAGLVTAGCTQSSRSSASPSSDNPTPGSGDGTMAAGPGNGGQNSGHAGEYPGSNLSRQPRSQGGFLNETRISAAAGTLGVTEDALKEALNSTANGRPDMNAAAQKLGVTQQQLSDALGIPAGTGGSFNGTWTRGGHNAPAAQPPA